MRQPLKMTPFSLKVIALIQKIPRGKVATYGQIAALAGKPHGARGVGWILRSCSKSHKLPWQRVIGSQGKIAFPMRNKHFREQRSLLLKEKVMVSDTGAISLNAYGWKKKVRAPKNGPFMFR